jgi:hypothetical protein
VVGVHQNKIKTALLFLLSTSALAQRIAIKRKTNKFSAQNQRIITPELLPQCLYIRASR